MFRRKVTTILPHHQIKAQKSFSESAKSGKSALQCCSVAVQNPIGKKSKKNLIFIYIYKYKTIFGVLDSPKTNCNTATLQRSKKIFEKVEKKSINACISQKKVVTLYRN